MEKPSDRIDPKDLVKSSEKKDVTLTKKIPAALTLQKIEDTGEKSPKARTVLELFKRYNYKKSEKNMKTVGKDEKCVEERFVDGVNVGFDEMSTDERSGFLEKLKMLTIEKKSPMKTDGVSGNSSPAARFLKRITPSRRNGANTRQNNEKVSEVGKKGDRKNNEKPVGSKRKDASRRLNFGADSRKAAEKSIKDDDAKVVATMTREYEKMLSADRGLPIRKSNRQQGPIGSLDTPSSSPIKGSVSMQSTPEQQSSSECLVGEAAPKKGRVPLKRQSYRESGMSSASWHGELPPRDYTSPTFSRKIFVGGVPWDITESALKDSFGEFGNCSVEWPGQEARYRSGQLSNSPTNSKNAGKYGGCAATGYVYMIFEDERAVAALLHECSQEIGGAGEWYFKIRAQRSKSTEIRQVQIIPWVTSDSLYCQDESIMDVGIEPKRTVFVGALHGMMTAQVLHSIMEDCFGSVECVQLDTDKFKYPIGSGRVTFAEHGAYFKSIEIGYLFVHTSKFRKRVQIDPFLESTNCMVCNMETAHCFCRNRNCFKYYCNNCWAIDHSNDSKSEVHIPVIVPSSASKAYNIPNRRSSSYTNSPVKSSSSSSQNQSMSQYLLGGGPLPVIVGGPAPTLSTVYGYMAQTTPISPSQHAFIPSNFETSISQSEPCFNNNTPVSSVITSPTLYMSAMLTPQKGSNTDMIMPSVYGSSNIATSQFFPPSSFYANSNMKPNITASPVPPTQFYGPNIIYGYVPQAGNSAMYDMKSSVFNSPPQKSFH